ncbi:MAG: hypothetical protein HDS89_00705 [Bacteroidales bacterium]|nr:hypothetical protein [Bacteroidales bacterium]
MKNIKIIFSMLVLMALGLASCSDDLSNPPVNNPGIHQGTWNDPMSCYQVALGTSVEGYTAIWVTGYIVGYVNTDIASSCSDATATFTAPATVQTNILMADDPNETDWNNCISVQLPSGPVRNALNLGNADNKGKQVTILGIIGSKYCSVYGVRSVSAYMWGDEGDESIDIIEKPVRPTIQEWDFLNNANGFTFDQTTPATSTAEIWKVTEKYGWVASGFISSNCIESESTLISPVIDLSNYEAVTMNVHSAANKFNDQDTFLAMTKVLVREEGSMDWTAVEMPVAPAGDSWTFSDSGEIDLSAFDGKKIQVGFYYTSSTAVAGSWEIDKLQVFGQRK